jgi:amidase
VQATGYRLALPPPRHQRLADFRVLVLDTHPLAPTSHEVQAALHRFVEQLARCGCRLATASPLLPDLARVATTFSTLLMSFFGAELPEAGYRGLQQAAARLAPSDVGAQAEQLRGLVLTHRDWVLADRVRAGLSNRWRQLFREFDVVLCPVALTPALAHDHSEMRLRRIQVDGAEVAYALQSMWITPASLAGLPATVMPIGLGATGLPVGAQIVGPLLEDRTTLAFAELAEREFGGFVAPPGFGD